MKDFYQLSISQIFDRLTTQKHGLTEAEAQKRLRDYGPNKLLETKIDGYFLIFLRQFKSSLIYVLFFACLIIFILGDWIDGIIILIVLIFNAIVGMIQEGKAQNTLLALKNFVETKAVVIREGKEIIISDKEVVPGDVLVLQEGEKIAADARIFLSRNLKIDEAALTGESELVEKIIEPLDTENLPNSDQKNTVFKGTHVQTGNGLAVVTATGIKTIIGKIAKGITMIDSDIPLKKNIERLSNLIIVVVGVISVLLFIVGLLYDKGVKEMFTVVVSLAVSIIPEGLPIVITLVLATGVWRMSQKNALVKKLQAVEALGQARVIAVDKTGTITKNEMVVQKIYTDGKFFGISGVGYEPQGSFSLNDKVIDHVKYPNLLFTGKVAAFCSNARIMFSESDNLWRVAGDPTEAAMLVFAEKLGLNLEDLEIEFPRLEEIPFDYRLKYHASLNLVGGKRMLSVAGAPEVILDLCQLSEKEKREAEKIFFSFSESGLRVIALAQKKKIEEKILLAEQVNDLEFIGFLGIKDSLRPEIFEAVIKAKEAQIRVVMITGDHKITAQALATEAGIFHPGDLILTGQEIDNFSDQELMERLDRVTVFSRVTPEHKMKIINSYKKRGEIIAMTGDGVNDALSLVSADLGIAMGKIGTEVAKEAADIILLDDNLNSIISAVEEGRNIYKTIKKVILYLFSTSLGELFVVAGALLLGYPLPLLAGQIIWLNLVTDGFLTVALAMESKEDGLLKNYFGKIQKSLVDRIMLKRMFIMAIPMMIGTLFLFKNYFEADIVKGWTISVTTLAVFQWFNAWNCRHESKSVFKTNPFSNKYLIWAMGIVILLQLFMVYSPFMQKIFRTTSLSLNDWLIIISISFSVVLVEEIRKFFSRTYKSAKLK